jgi:hypothetical protein
MVPRHHPHLHGCARATTLGGIPALMADNVLAANARVMHTRCTCHRSANSEDKRMLKQYTGSDGADIAWDFIRISMFSVAKMCVTAMQVRKAIPSLTTSLNGLALP